MKQIYNTPKAPKAIGPYNQAIEACGLLFISGQIALDPSTEDVIKGSIEEETDRVMKNLHIILNHAGLNFDSVVKSTIYIKDMKDFQSINKIYGHYFNKDTAPARECVQVSELPKGVNVEISMIAKR